MESILCFVRSLQMRARPERFRVFFAGPGGVLPLRKFTFHPFGSMACVGARAIAVSGVQFNSMQCTDTRLANVMPVGFGEAWGREGGLECGAVSWEYRLDS
jgi:hypothetical protein